MKQVWQTVHSVVM